MYSADNVMNMQIPPRPITVGGTSIHRLLPFAKKRMVGPFIFFDHCPATEFEPGRGMNVPPHPHIGLSTLSYLMEGQVFHHDSLDCRQTLKPGEVNWMTAGKGIAHSERVPPEVLAHKYRMHLLQFWVALPLEQEDCEPHFQNHREESIPRTNMNGVDVKVVAGEAFGLKSPVEVFSPLFFVDVKALAKSALQFQPQEDHETAFYILEGALTLGEKTFKQGDFIVLNPGAELQVSFLETSRIVLLGGQPLPEPRHIYWNFVSSSKDKIEAAKKLWRSGDFPQVPGETDNILLPAD